MGTMQEMYVWSLRKGLDEERLRRGRIKALLELYEGAEFEEEFEES